MAKSSMSKPVKSGSLKPAPDCKYHDRDLKSVNPMKEQFEPKGSEPVRQRYKMAGGQ
jgi:hypothetical protein